MLVEVLESPAAAVRLAGARARLQGFPPATEVLVVGATREAADDLVRDLTAERRATFGLHRLSLGQLAMRLARGELASRGLLPASGMGPEAAAARAAFRLLSQGRLSHLRAVADAPGLPPALASTLAELRLARATAGALAGLGAPGPAMGELLAAYEEELVAAGTADRAGLYALAADALRQGSGEARNVVDRPVLLLDVPVHDVATADLLAALLARSSRALATLPSGDERTLAALSGMPGLELVPASGPSGRTPAEGSSLSRLRTHLFSPSAPPEGERDASVVFLSAPGEGRECVEIARLLLREAAGGVPFDRMAVLLRAPELYRTLLDAALARAGVPAAFTKGTARPDPAGRAFLALLQCRLERLSARRFGEYLSLAQVPDLPASGEPEPRDLWVPPADELLRPATVPEAAPEEPAFELPPEEERASVDGVLRAPWRWEELIVEAAVIGGKERWERRLAGLARELSRRRDELASEEPDSGALPRLEREIENLAHLTAFALPVIRLLSELPAEARWAEWVPRLVDLAPRVLRRPERVLAALAELSPLGELGPVTLDEVARVLLPRLGVLEDDPPPRRYGHVFVGSLPDARGRSFDVVFVPGLAEKLFPRRPQEDPMLLDALREELGRASSFRPLVTQDDRAQAERLLLRLAAGAAERRLYLSYPRVDVEGSRARVTSFYGLDVARARTGRIPDFEELAREAAAVSGARLGWPAPPEPREAIDELEWDLSRLARLLSPETRVEDARGRARYVLKLNPHLARSLRARWARWRPAWSAADGLVRATDVTGPLLEEHRPSRRPYSVSALQRYAVCPYQFLLASVYRLEPRAEPESPERLDALTRGSLYHRVLARLFRRLKAEGRLPLRPEGLTEAREALESVFQEVADAAREELAPAIDRVFQDEMSSLKADLRVLLARVSESREPWTPEHFELGFGLSRDRERKDERDPASRPEPVRLLGLYPVRGAIDLVERRESAAAAASSGEPTPRTPGGAGGGAPPPNAAARRVTDYKTGARRENEGLVVSGGAVLQPMLYALALEELGGVPVEESRLWYCTERGGYTSVTVKPGLLQRHYARGVLEAIDASVAAGVLPPYPRPGECARCDFLEVCGSREEDRVRRKRKLPALAALDDLRSYP